MRLCGVTSIVLIQQPIIVSVLHNLPSRAVIVSPSVLAPKTDARNCMAFGS